MTNEVLETIRRRRSVRAFRPDQIDDASLAAIVEAGQYAPNGGDQAWHFAVVQNFELLERLNRLAKGFAARSPMPWLVELGNDPNFHSTYQAPAVILVSGDERNVCAESDTAAATENMLLAAESLGLGSCWGYFVTQAFLSEEGEALRAEMGIPEGYKVFTSVMLGHRAGDLPPAAERKGGRVTYIK